MYTRHRTRTRALLHCVQKTLVHDRAQHVARWRIPSLLYTQPLDRHSQNLWLREHCALAMRLRPGLVVDVAIGVGLDLDEPVDVDVGPVCALGIPTMRVPLGPAPPAA